MIRSALLISIRFTPRKSQLPSMVGGPDLERGRDASGDGRAASRFGRQSGPGVPGSARIRRGLCTALSICSAPAYFAICCGYEDADDLDHLRSDPAFKLACGTAARTPVAICVPKPTLSAPGECSAPARRDPTDYTLVDAWMDSYPREPASVTLDIDDTATSSTAISSSRCSTLIMTNAASCPIHVYDTEKSRPVAVVLRPGTDAGRRRGACPSSTPGTAHPHRMA